VVNSVQRHENFDIVQIQLYRSHSVCLRLWLFNSGSECSPLFRGRRMGEPQSWCGRDTE